MLKAICSLAPPFPAHLCDLASTTAWLQEGISTELSLFGIQYPIADETEVFMALNGSIDATSLLGADQASGSVALRYNNNRVLGQGFAPYHCTAEPSWGNGAAFKGWSLVHPDL